MSDYWHDPWLTVYQGDCRAALATLPAESVHCVVTSPPYWGLRDYGISDQLGLEPTPEAYVANLVAVFSEVRRVMRADGTVWLNLGDSYAAQGGSSWPAPTNTGNVGAGHSERRNNRPLPGLKPKDLVGIPWRVAFALQADGWYLRSDVIWSKPNPMPESVTDRPTKSHEYVFMLSKSAKYFWDADAVREAWADEREGWSGYYERSLVGKRRRDDGTMRQDEGMTQKPQTSGRNIRSVWTIATQPYPGAHFATFPRKLVEPCIKAGTSERGVCPECGAPWVRVTVGGNGTYAQRKALGYDKPQNMKVGEHPGNHRGLNPAGMTHDLDAAPKVTTGWRPSCRHDAESIPATVLDPFAGSGTTGLVAQSLSRRAILVDLNADYLVQALERNRDIPLGLGAA